MKKKKTLLSLSVVIVLVMGVISIAYAVPSYLTPLSAACPGTSCTSCHGPSGPPPFTAYGTSFSNISTHSTNPSGAIATLGCPGATPTPTPTPTPIPACTSYMYTWGACQPNGTQTPTSTIGVPAGCSGGATPLTSRTCTYTAPTCTSFTYSAWGACQPSGTQTRTVATSSPSGCTGGSPVTSQTCTYMPPGNVMLISPATSGFMWDDTYKRLGIGTTNPRWPLQIDAALPIGTFNVTDATSEGAFLVTENGNYVGSFEGFGSNFGNTALRNSISLTSQVNDLGSINLITKTGGTWLTRMFISNSGNLGIGTTTPTQTLEVNGGMRLNTSRTQPACNANTRGTFWVDQYTTGDFVDVCILSGGSYVWRTIAQ